MPRVARIKSISGNYHAVLRGINKQRIFEDAQDYEKFLWILKDKQKSFGFSLFAWCLMPNHIHLLLKENSDPLSQIFRGIGASFVYWYNAKYNRTGHLFEGRFRSEPVDDESYFLRVVRYIHLNPVKGKICKTPEEYRYSSYNHYFHNPRYSGSDLIFGLMERDALEQFHKEKNDDICLDIDNDGPKRMTDEQADWFVKKSFGIERTAMVQSLPEDQQERVILSLLKAGAFMNQISRLTGISVGRIEYYRDKH